MTKDQKKRLCSGCRNDFYNHGNNSMTGECWMLPDAQVIQLTQVGTWQRPPYHWTPQTTLSCHRPEGRHWIKRDDCRLVENGTPAQ